MIVSASRGGGCGHPAPGTRAADGCGCAERGPRELSGSCACAGPERCGVPCLERPLYSAGQLLTADALQLGQRYLEERLALRRYVDGVGVVCGLHVRCDPARPGWIVVEPGYAVDCCGRDLVLCEPVRMDLCAAITQCPRPRDPCGGTLPLDEWVEDRTRLKVVDLAGETVAPNRVRTWVLRAEPAWEGRDPVPVITRRDSYDPRPECRPSREAASLRLYVEPLRERSSDEQARDRTHRFRALGAPLFARLDQALASHPEGPLRARAVVDVLLRFVDDEPPRAACGVRGLLCALGDVLAGGTPAAAAGRPACELPAEVKADPERFLAGVVAVLVDGLREEYLAGECDSCCERAGVRLAHVRVDERLAGCGGDGCFIARIDTHPPGREALHPRDGWWRGDRVSLYDAYFRGAAEAGVLLTARGLRVTEREAEQSQFPPELPDHLQGWLKSRPEWRRLGVYQRSELYAAYGSNVMLWRVDGRVAAIDAGDDPYVAYEVVSHHTATDPATAGTASGRSVAALDPAPFEKTITGVGVKTEAHLYRAGIRNYAELAHAPFETLRSALGPRVPRAREQFDDIQAQARAIAAGDHPYDPADLERWSAEAAQRYAAGAGGVS